MAQGKRTPEEIIQKVRELLFENEDLYGKELKAAVEKVPAFAKLNISIRSYQSIKKAELPNIKMIKTSIPENKWSLGALASTNQITFEAVPYLMEMQKWAADQKTSINDLPFPPVTVRQAKWVSRILPLFFRMFSHHEKSSEVELGWLWRWSRAYSINERQYELTGKKEAFNTSELDAALPRGDRIDTFGDTYVRFSGEVNPGDKDDSIFVVTSDEKILKRTLKEGPMEKSAHSIRELPKFKRMMERDE